ncbi:hypothetical protein ACFV3R_09415 [Streptomyces sp. NPDC059740]|uniref:hypothetical protein n=1 Tax=Streptomyces sp. NPDC059740 TaxID=3346926 RepID=UPI003647CB2D
MPARRRRPNELLGRLLAEADMSAAELARSVNRLAATAGVRLTYDRTAVAHWVAGSRPRPFVAQLVAEVLTRRTGRLVSVGETGLAQDGGAEFSGGTEREDPARGLVALARLDVQPARRAGLQAAVFREAEVPGRFAGRPGPIGRPGAVARAGSADVDRVRFFVDQFHGNWARFGGGHARASLASYLADDIGRLLALPASRHTRSALLSATGQLAHLLGNMTADAGLHGLAQRYYRLALGTAAEARDRRTAAVTLRAMSLQAVRVHSLGHAVDLADSAVSAIGRSDDGDLRAFVLAQRAYVRALASERRGARQDLQAAERHLGRPSAEEGLFAGYPVAGFAYRKGRTLHRLGDTPPALEALRYAVTDRLEHEHRVRALSRARLALILLGQGAVEEACAHGRLFAEEYPQVRSHRSTLLLKELQARLTPFRRVPEVSVLLREVSALVRYAAAVR